MMKEGRGETRREERVYLLLLLPIHVVIYGGTSHSFSVDIKHIYGHDSVGMGVGMMGMKGRRKGRGKV